MIRLSERIIGVSGTNAVRWTLFLPVALLWGALVFVCAAAVANQTDSYFEDSGFWGGLLAGVFGGVSSVEVAVTIAPAYHKSVACIVTGMSVLLAAGFVLWAHSTNNVRLFIDSIISGSLYSLAAVGATIYVFRRRV